MDEIKDMIVAIEKQMMASLEEIRSKFGHSGNKGASVEKVFREFLSTHLPRRFDVGHGEVIDANEHRSGQVDVVVTNEHHPFSYPPDDAGLFFIEGVSAMGEIKTVLTTQELQNTLDSSMKFKQLEVSRVTGETTQHRSSEDAHRFWKWPPCFLVAFESQISLSNIRDKVIEYPSQHLGSEHSRFTDAIFVLGKGSVINFGRGEGVFRGEDENGDKLVGWTYLNSEHVLFEFLAWLSVIMPEYNRHFPVLSHYTFGIR
jgi:hypothetical protein